MLLWQNTTSAVWDMPEIQIDDAEGRKIDSYIIDSDLTLFG